MGKAGRELKRRITHSVVVLLTVMGVSTVLFCTQAFGARVSADVNMPADSEVAGESKLHVNVEAAPDMKWGLISAAVAFGLGAIGAGIAIAHVGAAAMGAVAEKPQIAGQALIFVALAEGLVVFGFITALMILGKV